MMPKAFVHVTMKTALMCSLDSAVKFNVGMEQITLITVTNGSHSGRKGLS